MLDDPLLVLQAGDEAVRATLPQALAQLCADDLTGFEGLAAHQRVPWLLFLCQVAAMALERASRAQAAEDEDEWRGLADPGFWRAALLALTPGAEDTAWSLLVEDASRPALLQPPVRRNLERYGVIGATPDEIDLLVTAKAHDVKPARLDHAEPHHWLFALVSLQTHQGYSGRGNFGIARMNGGFASRPMLTLDAGQGWPSRFRRGVRVALRARADALTTDTSLFIAGDLPLLWLEPWDEEIGLSPARLDPLFVEICRRVRLVRGPDGTILARGRPSECARVAVPKELKGNLFDAWTPVGKDGAALTVGAGGFDYRLLFRILCTDEFKRPAAMQALSSDPDEIWLHAAVLVRGQGKTEGLHERWLRVPAFEDGASRESAAEIGAQMIVDAKNAKDALRLALLTFLQGAPKRTELSDRSAETLLDAADQEIDAVFFGHLFDRVSAGRDEATEWAWKKALLAIVRRIFDEGRRNLSPPESRRERAHAIAGALFYARLAKAGLRQQPPGEPVVQEAA
jgi:CRISPR system Cascade subunit CasA